MTGWVFAGAVIVGVVTGALGSYITARASIRLAKDARRQAELDALWNYVRALNDYHEQLLIQKLNHSSWPWFSRPFRELRRARAAAFPYTYLLDEKAQRVLRNPKWRGRRYSVEQGIVQAKSRLDIVQASVERLSARSR